MESNALNVRNHFRGSDFLWRIETIVDNAFTLARSIGNVTWVVIPRTTDMCVNVNWIAKHVRLGVCLSN